jgi:F0F1-type ATP synthase membrane subunit b/b'
MFSSPSLQFILLINVFLIGVIVTVAIRHAYLHFHPKPEVKPVRPAPPTVKIPDSIREHLIHESEEKLQSILDHAAVDFEHDLKSTSEKLNNQLVATSGKIVEEEMKQYQASLVELRKQAEQTLAGTQSQMSQQQVALKAALDEHQRKLAAKLAEESAAEQQRLRAQIDTKLADAITAFLTDTLQHNVDLGAQSDYLISMLEEHKAELTKEMVDEP